MCSELVRDGSARCAEHKVVAWAPRVEVKRISGRRLQAARAALFAREPLCRECRKVGRSVLGKIRDHIVPLAESGSDDDENVQPLCASCDRVKTAADSARGRGHKMSTPPKAETVRVPLFLRARVEGGGGVGR